MKKSGFLTHEATTQDSVSHFVEEAEKSEDTLTSSSCWPMMWEKGEE